MVALTSEGHVTEIVAMRGHSLELDQGGRRDEPTVLMEAGVIVGGKLLDHVRGGGES